MRCSEHRKIFISFTKIADQIVIVIGKDARVQAVLVVHLEVVHLHQVVRQEVQAPAPVLHVPALVTRRVRFLAVDFFFIFTNIYVSSSI